jgi:hypothetical protein
MNLKDLFEQPVRPGPRPPGTGSGPRVGQSQPAIPRTGTSGSAASQRTPGQSMSAPGATITRPGITDLLPSGPIRDILQGRTTPSILPRLDPRQNEPVSSTPFQPRNVTVDRPAFPQGRREPSDSTAGGSSIIVPSSTGSGPRDAATQARQQANRDPSQAPSEVPTALRLTPRGPDRPMDARQSEPAPPPLIPRRPMDARQSEPAPPPLIPGGP